MTERVPLEIVVVNGNPTVDELAAVTSVLAGALDELAADGARAATPQITAWARVQRPMREPLQRGRGSWRGFRG